MTDFLKYLSGSVFSGLLLAFLGNYFLGKIKNKIDFNEIQEQKNHDFDKRIAVLEALMKK